MPILLVCASMFAQDCLVVTRNWEFYDTLDECLSVSVDKARILILAKQKGYESYLIFLIQIENCKTFSIASDIDPVYFKVFKDALKKNVNVLCYDCKFSNKGIEINDKIKIL